MGHGANRPIARPENLFAKKCKQGLTDATARFNGGSSTTQ
jgi:hypothetical protein